MTSIAKNRKQTSLSASAGLLMAAKTLAYVISFALPLLLARRLSLADYGLYRQAFLIVGSALGLLPLAIDMSVYYFLPREQEIERRGAIVINVMLFNTAVGSLVLLAFTFCPQLLVGLVGSYDLITHAPLIGLVVLLWVSSAFLEIVMLANQEAKLATAVIIVSQLSKTTLLLGAVLIFGTVRSLIIAAVIQGVLQLVILLRYLRLRFGAFWRRFSASMLRRQLAYSLPVGGASLLYTLLVDMHNYFVSRSFGAATYAVYSVGCLTVPLIGIIGESVASVMIPHVSHLQNRGDKRGIIEVTARAMRKLALVYFPAYACLLVLGREFITFLFTERFAASYSIFAVNLTLILPLVIMTDPVFRAYYEHRFFKLKLLAVMIPTLFGTLWVGARFGDSMTVISATVMFTLLYRLGETWKAWGILGVKWYDIVLIKDVGKIAIAAAIAGLITFIARQEMVPFELRPFWMLCGGAVVFGIVYIFALFGMKVATEEERERMGGHLAGAERPMWRVCVRALWLLCAAGAIVGIVYLMRRGRV